MISFFNEWAQGIVVAVIIATIVEMLVPNSKSKKYIKSIIGIYILYTIIVPVINKVKGNDFNMNLDEYINSLDNTSVKTVSIDTNSNIKEMYITNLKSDITNKLKNKGYTASNINILVKDNENLDIDKISMNVQKIEEQPEKNENKIEVKVNKIEIDTKSVETKPERISRLEENEVKTFISDTYNVDKNRIEINKGGDENE